jgi:hypothetical protein
MNHQHQGSRVAAAFALRLGSVMQAGAGVALGAVVAACGGTASELDGAADDVGRVEAAVCQEAVITAPPNVTAQACGATRSVTVGHATATGCGGALPVRGQVIRSNFETLPTPIDVVSDAVTLPAGSHVVLWTVVGQEFPGVFQLVNVQPGLQSEQSFIVGHRASVGIVRGAEPGPVAMLNRGPGGITLGNSSLGGTAVSVGPITLEDRARLLGDATSRGAITLGTGAAIAGTSTPFGSVSPFPLLPFLPAFPPVTGGDVTVNANMLQNLGAGSYGSLNVNSGGVLFLGAGNYFFQNLNINSGTVVAVAAPAPGSSRSATRIFVANQFALRTQFLNPGGSGLAEVLIGHTGSGSVTLDTNFIGTFVAPNADLTLGTGAPKQFIGAFYARTLRVGNDTQLLCNSVSAVGGPL